MKIENILHFPEVCFHYRNRLQKSALLQTNLPFIDEMDDWWDYWFEGTKSGRTASLLFQLCGTAKNQQRLLQDLVIYVYRKNAPICDENRIDTITNVSVEWATKNFHKLWNKN